MWYEHHELEAGEEHEENRGESKTEDERGAERSRKRCRRDGGTDEAKCRDGDVSSKDAEVEGEQEDERQPKLLFEQREASKEV